MLQIELEEADGYTVCRPVGELAGRYLYPTLTPAGVLPGWRRPVWSGSGHHVCCAGLRRSRMGAAAVSAGVLNEEVIVDLNYEEDKAVSVDLNLAATEEGDLIEVQASGEEATFARAQLEQMLEFGQQAITGLIAKQRGVLNDLPRSLPQSQDPSGAAFESSRGRDFAQ